MYSRDLTQNGRSIYPIAIISHLHGESRKPPIYCNHLAVDQWVAFTDYEDVLRPPTGITLIASSSNINEQVDKVSSYISFCVENIIPTKKVSIFPNNKPG